MLRWHGSWWNSIEVAYRAVLMVRRCCVFAALVAALNVGWNVGNTYRPQQNSSKYAGFLHEFDGRDLRHTAAEC
jgi:hypothetical protein